jgi:hypothetical protein
MDPFVVLSMKAPLGPFPQKLQPRLALESCPRDSYLEVLLQQFHAIRAVQWSTIGSNNALWNKTTSELRGEA